jgi:hypothetical protein
MKDGQDLEWKHTEDRYTKALEIFKEGAITILEFDPPVDQRFLVNDYEVDLCSFYCACPDFKSRKRACKHYFAAMLFSKKKTLDIEGLERAELNDPQSAYLQYDPKNKINKQ